MVVLRRSAALTYERAVKGLSWEILLSSSKLRLNALLIERITAETGALLEVCWNRTS